MLCRILSSMKNGCINIFDYVDYRLFLKDFYAVRKKENRHFSFRMFAQKAGVSASLMRDVISGRRRLSVSVASRYIRAMDMTAREADYFILLVQFVNARTNREKNDCYNKMNRLRARLFLKFLGADQYGFYSAWYHSAVRELVALPGFREDPEWIASALKPSITPAQARKSLELMERLGIVRRDRDGRLTQSDPAISSEYDIRTLAMRNFHEQMIDRAKEALDEFPLENREPLSTGTTNGITSRP